MNAVALRLKPQQDLKIELDRFIQEQCVDAACILTCVGSLTQVKLRFANQANAAVYQGHFEIVSLVGVMSQHGSHYHMAIADKMGCVRGGHVLPGCLVYTTAEIIVGILPHLKFQREYDQMTGYNELAIYPSN
ncbi:DNA-binding protein [Oscillatoria sp. FACHB-1407]|uniref:PPC domain-containing DNA-binding protein n=1 Tax=Oscillatoria sp. FACHB-1407 TaxID=2692847 RepID=UPI0016833E9C|nr:PPC domain-containing DNA-binding protein [Oscillatoria sp. FACHB-1407]MBD2460929.1 DNA-binding protein [Oscillatoria sp. FACHB-1407]